MVTKQDFMELLQKSIGMVLADTQQRVAEPLPRELSLYLEAFGQRGKALSLEEVVSFLYRNNTFPRIIDLAFRGIRDDRTCIWLRPSDHAYVSDFSQTWNTPDGMGPFKILIPGFLPHSSGPVSTEKLKEEGANW